MHTVRNVSQCQTIAPGTKMCLREVGRSEKMSWAHVTIQENGACSRHLHKHGDEAFYILKGRARVVLDGHTITLTAGQLVHIPAGTVHQIFNDWQEELEFLCNSVPAWSMTDYEEVAATPAPKEDRKFHVVKNEECPRFKSETKETVLELAGRVNGNLEKFSMANVTVQENGHSSKHFHRITEEVYFIIKGKARMELDGKKVEAGPGDLIQIPAGTVHQIFNDCREDLEFNCLCVLAWRVEDSHSA